MNKEISENLLACPSLEISGEKLTDTHAILIYLSSLSNGLYRTDQQVIIDSWLETVETQFKPALTTWISPYLGSGAYKDTVVSSASKDSKALIKELDGSLKKSKFLCGDSLTIADISLASELVLPFRMLIDENTRKGYKSVIEWLSRIFEISEFNAIWGPFVLCTEIAQIPNTSKPIVAGKPAQEKKVQAKKREKVNKDELVNKEEQERKQKERLEKKEKAAKAKLEEEIRKKNEALTLKEKENSTPEEKKEETIEENKAT